MRERIFLGEEKKSPLPFWRGGQGGGYFLSSREMN